MTMMMRSQLFIAVVIAMSGSGLALEDTKMTSLTVSKQGSFQRQLTMEPAEPRKPFATLSANEKASQTYGDVLKGIEQIFLSPDVSNIPPVLQFLIATVWVLMITSLPFILPKLDGKPVTVMQKAVGGFMLVAILGGLYLFTHEMQFNCDRFSHARNLTVIECVYFMAQIITTVGYGDITPVGTKEQCFVALYILAAVFVIAMLVSQLFNHCYELVRKAKDQMLGLTPKNSTDIESVHDLLQPHKPSIKPFLTSLAIFVAFDVIWVLFFTWFPGEKKSFFQALYMALITSTSVGFGAFTPVTEGGMVFSAFFMIAACAALANVIGNFCEFVAMVNQFERFTPDVKHAVAAELKAIAKNDGFVSEMEFFRLVVQHDGIMSAEQVDAILKVFEKLKPQTGAVAMDTVLGSMALDNTPQTPMALDKTPQTPMEKLADRALAGGSGV